MVNEDFTYFEINARDEFLLRMKITCICWIVMVLFNLFSYFTRGGNYIFVFGFCIATILIIYNWVGMSEKNREIKELIIDVDGIMLYNFLDKKYYTLKWYQIKKIQLKGPVSNNGWELIVKTKTDNLEFYFSPYYWHAKPKKCIKVIENCVDVKAKLEIK